MKTIRGVIFAAVCALSCLVIGIPQANAAVLACQSVPQNLVANCGFETGTFSSWTLSGNDVPREQDNLYGIEGTDPFPVPNGTAPAAGNSQAFFADLPSNPITLSQTLSTGPGF